MARLPLASRESVPENQRAAFDELLRGYGSVPRYGPSSVMIHVPKAHQLVNAVNNYLRSESSLPKKIQELAMLVTARELDCQHIWNAHAASARKAGVRDAIVDALRDRKEFPSLAPDEAAVVHYGQEFFRTHRVSRGAFQAALEQLGRQGVVELSMVLGNYSLLALLINSFDTDLPSDRTERLLPV
ncbi:MAG: carboxymuconolactone decarboxylase family protein [Betaproteobacteria bacterium]|nr:carboxymuconolactone decarboxylase family protein [Betaproteobacteria bacterium]